ncbi:quinone oxidoreductase family protein [Undibacterium oligocarboniphilum]|uniref:Quinone oxidoreductase n=1 Tax=Undibacterium oligocarboniphilum TaxID=666702 RepID=A0A850QDS7_9BURK|nr:quinone oxidoreductase [Undibacterium oligocarboniphilum]MBC3869067.1 quinone oxidoreductase [Undibacterium oligocarboniphilum]NVO77047.1 quinone oxidoreductase [Undibacterium oligocarboniphilum]
MVKAVRIQHTGGPEVMEYVDVPIDEPGPGEVRVRHHACGLNYIDVYFRTGLYAQPLPAGLGMEAAGVVEAVGSGVTHLRAGDRVAYAGRPVGAYAEARIMPADNIVRLPDSISFDTAAAMMLQGLTVQYLFHRTFPLRGGETILFHAAAGGVGLIACQWARAIGVTMIGTVGSDEKAELAKAHGCAHVINYNTENFVQRVREITGGKGVPVVYDSIGRDTFIGSLDCLSPMGMMVSFGSASGPVPSFSLNELASRGSLFITRPSLMNYTAKREDLEQMAAQLFAMVESGKVKIDIRQRYPLSEVQQAHRDLEARKTTGSTLLIP